MERSQGIFILIILAVLAVLAAGCTGLNPAPATPAPTPVPAVITTEPTTAPVTTPPTPTPVPVIIATTPAPLTSDDVTQHFMDLAFGSGNTKLDRLAYTPSSQTPLNTISVYNGNDADTAIVQSFISQFNDLSATNQFSTNLKTTTMADIVIRFVSPAGLSAIPQESYTKEIKTGSLSYAKIGPQTIYINAELTGEERSHVVLRSLLYALGFKGETLKYPDSVFYYQYNTNTRLSIVDQKAIQIMYGAGLYPGMTVANVRNVVYVKTN